jgi:hypothetical protein
VIFFLIDVCVHKGKLLCLLLHMWGSGFFLLFVQGLDLTRDILRVVNLMPPTSLQGELMGEQGKELSSTGNLHRGLAIVVVLLIAVVISTVFMPTVCDRANSWRP